MKRLLHILFVFSFSCLTAQISLKELNQRAKIFFAQSEFDSCLRYSVLLAREAEKADSFKYTIKANFLTADVSSARGNNKKTLEIYFETLKLCKKKNDLANESLTLNKIGILYFNQKSYAEAARYFEEEIQIKEKLGDEIYLANSLLNVAMLYRRQQMFDKADQHLKRARTIALKKKDKDLQANYFNGQAAYYFNIFSAENKLNAYGNDPNIWDRQFTSANLRDSAEIYWLKALKIWSDEKDVLSSINPMFNLGYVYQSRKDYPKALKHYLRAKSVTDSLGLINQKVTLYGNLAEVYYDMKDFKRSSDYLRKRIELKDSLQQDEIDMYNLRLGKQYELETNRALVQQEQSILLKNAEIATQRKRIYIFILLFIVLTLLIVGIVFYMNFNKRLNKKIEEAKQKFFMNIMHEIRTPLSMIQAPLKTLKPRLQDEESRYYIGLAEKNVTRLNELINQMLDISKIETSSYRLSSSVGNLDLFLKELIATYEKAAIEKNIGFIAEINSSNSLLVFDRDALEKIITNLLSNALKYTKAKGSIGITVNVEEHEKHADLLIEVWDTGIGIATSEQQKIFSRFFRSEKALNQAPGVGIGLSLVKDIVTAFRGRISFTSEENKGTKFIVELELKHPAQLPAEQEVLAGEGGKPVLLLIEDDEDILDFVSMFLKGNNFEIVSARNGNIARALLKNTTPDLIVTDLMMDELDGLSFIKEMKNNKGLNHIPVIVLSAKSSGQTRVEVLNAGAQAFLTKPFLPEELLSVISNQLALISKIKSELKTKIDTKKPGLTAEQKFTSTEPYTQKLFDLIFKNLDNSELSVESLAELMSTNRSHFQRKIKNLTGYSPSELIKFIRLEKSREFLSDKKGNITEVAYMSGFSSQSYFTKCFTQYFGYPPTQLPGR